MCFKIINRTLWDTFTWWFLFWVCIFCETRGFRGKKACYFVFNNNKHNQPTFHGLYCSKFNISIYLYFHFWLDHWSEMFFKLCFSYGTYSFRTSSFLYKCWHAFRLYVLDILRVLFYAIQNDVRFIYFISCYLNCYYFDHYILHPRKS